MVNKIDFEKGKIIIGYQNSFDDYPISENEELFNLFNIYFIPKVEMNEISCSMYIGEKITEIINEAKKIFSKNSEFFNNFEIKIFPELRGYSFKECGDKIIIEDSWLYVESKLKN